MSKKLSSALTIATAYFFTAASALAAPANNQNYVPSGALNPNLDPNAIPKLVINIMFGLATFLAVAYLMYGGIRWITSRGDKVAVESARKHIVAAVIGLVIVVGSFFILNTVLRILGISQGVGNFTLPTVSPAP